MTLPPLRDEPHYLFALATFAGAIAVSALTLAVGLAIGGVL